MSLCRSPSPDVGVEEEVGGVGSGAGGGVCRTAADGHRSTSDSRRKREIEGEAARRRSGGGGERGEKKISREKREDK